jgi:hypothetical protein
MTRRTFNATNSVLLGDCVGLMRGLDAESVDSTRAEKELHAADGKSFMQGYSSKPC